MSLNSHLMLIQLYFFQFFLISVLCGRCLWYNQRILVYPFGFKFLIGLQGGVRTPRVPYKDVEIVARDKVRLRSYLIPHSSSTSLRGTVIIFHGNAMNHGDVVEPHAILFSVRGFTVLTAEYRGYGLSEGTPSESGLRLDAQAAFDFVANDPELSKKPIVIYGQSLGGAVAIDVTTRNADKVSALIVENTFCSIPHLVRERMGTFLSLLTTQKWRSATKLAGITPSLPILMLSGLRDSVIPSSQMAELWEVAKTRRAKKNTGWLWFAPRRTEDEECLQPDKDVFETFGRGDHNDTYLQPGYWETVARFLDHVVPPSESK